MSEEYVAVPKIKEPDEHCNAWIEKRQKHCNAPAGQGTDHPGQGRCKFHGGSTAIITGRYSGISRPSLSDLVAEQELSDPDPMDLLPELQLLRALLVDFVNRYSEFKDALIAWHESYAVSQKPLHIMDISDASNMITKIAQIVKTIKDMQPPQAVPLETFNRVLETMGRTLAKHVQDPDTLSQIELEWGGIKIDLKTAKRSAVPTLRKNV